MPTWNMAARTVRKRIYPSVEIELDGPQVQSPYQPIPGEDHEMDPKLLKVGSLNRVICTGT